jgi:hypothetical protein
MGGQVAKKLSDGLMALFGYPVAQENARAGDAVADCAPEGGGRRTGQRHLTPLIGREEDIAMLLRCSERARQGDGQLVLIVGKADAANTVSRMTTMESHRSCRDIVLSV